MRSVEPDGEKIRRLRDAKVWSQQELADKSGTSLKTIVSVESGKRCFKYTLKQVAEALGVKAEELVAGNHADPTPELRPQPETIQLVLHIPLHKLDQTALPALLEQLQRLAGVEGELDVEDISEGSTIITLRLSHEDQNRLIRLLKQMDAPPGLNPFGRLFEPPNPASELRDLIRQFEQSQLIDE